MTVFFLISIFSSAYFVLHTDGYTEGDVRLKDGPSPLMGRVEIFHEGQWGTVCDDDWDDRGATVVCRQLGLSDVGTARCCAVFNQGTGSIWLDDVFCIGNEPGLSACSHRGYGIEDCSHSEDAGVICGEQWNPVSIRTRNLLEVDTDQTQERIIHSSALTTSFSDLRLTGNSVTEGRVEVYHQDEWIRVFDETWTAKEAAVVCRQMGFSRLSATAFTADLSSEEGAVCDVQCYGTESSLVECRNAGWGTNQCNQNQEANVACGVLRLVSEIGQPDAGIIELYFSRGWGSICDDHWDDIDATVVCRELGIGTIGKAVHESLLGKGSTRYIWLDNVDCKGNESTIFDCDHRELGVHDCDRSEIAGVVCSNVSEDREVTHTPTPTSATETPSQPPEPGHTLTWPNVIGGVTIVMCLVLILAVTYLTYVIKRKIQPAVYNQPPGAQTATGTGPFQNSYVGADKPKRSDGVSNAAYSTNLPTSPNRGQTTEDVYDDYYVQAD